MSDAIPETLSALRVPVASLVPYGANPRHGDVDGIATSLEVNGQYRPIVVRSGTNEVLAGNHTLLAARQPGWPDSAATPANSDRWRTSPPGTTLVSLEKREPSRWHGSMSPAWATTITVDTLGERSKSARDHSRINRPPTSRKILLAAAFIRVPRPPATITAAALMSEP